MNEYEYGQPPHDKHDHVTMIGATHARVIRVFEDGSVDIAYWSYWTRAEPRGWHIDPDAGADLNTAEVDWLVEKARQRHG